MRTSSPDTSAKSEPVNAEREKPTVSSRVDAEIFARIESVRPLVPRADGNPGYKADVVRAVLNAVFDGARIEAILTAPGGTFTAKIAHVLDQGLATQKGKVP